MLKKLILTLACTLLLGGAALAAEVKNPVVLMETSLGNVKMELFQKEAPISVKNFLSYVDSGYYNGTIFHRVIPNFMIQGGGFTPEITMKKPNDPIKNEGKNGLKNDRGTLAMARTMVVDSASSQFYINVVNNDPLNYQPARQTGPNQTIPEKPGYAVFGKVIEGMDVVDKIAAVQTGIQKGFRDVPVTPVVIKSMKVVK